MKNILSKIVGISALTVIGFSVLAPTSALAQSFGDDFSLDRPDHGRGGDFDLDRRGDRRDRDFDRDRGGRDRDFDRGGRGRDHDRDRDFDRDRGGHGRDRDRDFDRDRGGRRDDCRDESVTLYCKINGNHNYITAYTDCGYTQEGAVCNRVSTPGYYQVAMRIAYRCDRGRMVWLLGNDGQCKLSR